MTKGDMLGAVIVAAGAGVRLNADRPKCFVTVEGMPLFALALLPFQIHPELETVALVVPEGLESEAESVCNRFGINKVKQIVAGGLRRQDSVLKGLDALPAEVDRVLIHDGARPLLSQRALNQVIEALKVNPAVCLVAPVTDTIHTSGGDSLKPGPDRRRLLSAQTPQGFHRTILENAFNQADPQVEVTDEVSLVTQVFNTKVTPVVGDGTNVKITHSEELKFFGLQLSARARQIAHKGVRRMKYRVGEGYDVHRLVPNRPLILGGVKVPFNLGLEGHSDADVMLHAICDALLGAAGLGDIGSHFPDDSLSFKDISSLKLLAQVKTLLDANNFAPVNVDATLIMEQPRIAEYVYQMRRNIASQLKLDVGSVSIKATTSEGMGFVGEGRGAAARAVAMIIDYNF